MDERPLLLGHRGARKYAPENTIDAFEAAIEDGCDGFEFDVRVTSDRQAVVWHDPKFCGLSVARSSYDTLREVASHKGKEISLLQDVLKLGTRAFLNIELKRIRHDHMLIDLLAKYPPTRGVIVSSFQPQPLSWLSNLGASFDQGIICGNERELRRWTNIAVEAVMLYRGLVHKKQVAELKAAGKQVFVWTVNDAREMKKFAEMGVDGIISDDTKLLVKTLRPDFSPRHS